MAVKAAADWVQRNTTLLGGISIELTVIDSKCDASATLSDLGTRVRSGMAPDLIVGAGGCSGVAVPLRKMTAAMRIPMVGTIASSGLLSSQDLFVRFDFCSQMIESLRCHCKVYLFF